MKSPIVPLLVAFYGVAVSAQVAPSSAQIGHEVQMKVAELKAQFPEAKVQLSPNGLPSTISGLETSNFAAIQGSDAMDAVSKFMGKYEGLFPQAVDSSMKAKLEKFETHVDPTDSSKTIVTLRQKVDDLPVFGSEARFVVTQGLAGPMLSSGKFALATLTKDVTTKHELPPELAQNRAVQNYQQLLNTNVPFKTSESTLYPKQPLPSTPELVMFDPGVFGAKVNTGLRPTWIVTIGSMVMFIDANNGSLLHQYRNVHSLAQFQINDFQQSSDLSKPVLKEADLAPVPPDTPAEASMALQNAKLTRAFFTSLNRDILGTCTCNSHLLEPPSVVLNIRYSGTNTSVWDQGTSTAYFASGFANAVDVVSHEIAHGVTDFSSCLYYDYDSGAVSEFLSDFFASIIREQHGLAPWTIGDSLPGYSPPSQPLRSFSNPHLNGFNPSWNYSPTNRGQPEVFSEKVTVDDPICASSDSLNDCAHINSGILNKAAYLAAVGGSFNGQSITGVGSQKMTNIVNSMISVMNPLMDLPGTASLMVQTCTSLQLANQYSIDSTDCANLAKAFVAVGLRQ
jgi:Zn-dependent metalloprotease